MLKNQHFEANTLQTVSIYASMDGIGIVLLRHYISPEHQIIDVASHWSSQVCPTNLIVERVKSISDRDLWSLDLICNDTAFELVKSLSFSSIVKADIKPETCLFLTLSNLYRIRFNKENKTFWEKSLRQAQQEFDRRSGKTYPLAFALGNFLFHQSNQINLMLTSNNEINPDNRINIL